MAQKLCPNKNPWITAQGVDIIPTLQTHHFSGLGWALLTGHIIWQKVCFVTFFGNSYRVWEGSISLLWGSQKEWLAHTMICFSSGEPFLGTSAKHEKEHGYWRKRSSIHTSALFSESKTASYDGCSENEVNGRRSKGVISWVAPVQISFP